MRYAAVHAKEMRILADASSLEIFVNHGETVLTTRCYPDPASRGVRLSGGTASLRSMNRMEYFGWHFPIIRIKYWRSTWTARC